MPTIEMFVSLKMPDNIAITAFNTLKRMKYKQLIKLEKSDYYKFEVKDNVEDFKKKISQVDILVNSNKNKYSFSLKENNNKKQNKNIKIISILVKDLDIGTGLLSTLRERLGLAEIKKLDKGILWTMYFYKTTNAKKIAFQITKSLLMNENYQKYKLLK